MVQTVKDAQMISSETRANCACSDENFESVEFKMPTDFKKCSRNCRIRKCHEFNGNLFSLRPENLKIMYIAIRMVLYFVKLL